MNCHISDFHLFDTLFFFVEVERQHIAAFQTEAFQILTKLLFAFFMKGRVVSYAHIRSDCKCFLDDLPKYLHKTISLAYLIRGALQIIARVPFIYPI